jgi:hypothetical protein
MSATSSRQRMVERATRLLRAVHFGLSRFKGELFVVAAHPETASGAHDVARSRQLLRPWPSSRWSVVP